MRVATFSVGGERRVGVVDASDRSVAPFNIPAGEAEQGIVALFDKDGALPATLSPIALDRVALEAPIPLPRRNIFCVGKNYHEHAHEFSRSGFDSSAAAGAVPKHPIIFSKVPETVIPPRRRGADRSGRVDGDRLRGRACRHHRQAGARHRSGRRARPCLGLHHRQRCHRPRPAGPPQPVAGRQIAGHVLPDGALGGDQDEIDLADTGIRCFVNGDMRQSSNTRYLIFDIPTIIATISAGRDAPRRRHHRDRHAGRRRHRLRPAEISSRPATWCASRSTASARWKTAVREIAALTTVAVNGRGRGGRGRGPPVVMLHGLGGTSNTFQPQMDALRAYRVVRHRPAGQRAVAARRRRGDVLPASWRRCSASCMVLGVERAHFVGHSLGTIVCQMIAAERPALVRSLFLFGALAEPAETHAHRTARPRRAGPPRGHGDDRRPDRRERAVGARPVPASRRPSPSCASR